MILDVMIVDDDKDVRDYIKGSIPWENLGLNLVCEAEDTISAEEQFAIHQPHIVFMDVCMPSFDNRTGLDLAKEFCGKNPDVRVIVITGYADFEYAKRALEVGAVDLLLKPLHQEDIEKSLGKACAYYKEKRERLISKSVMEHLINENRDMLRERELASLFESEAKIDRRHLETQFRMLGVDIQNAKYAAVRILVEGGDRELSEEELHLAVIKDMCVQMFLENGFKCFSYMTDSHCLNCLVSWSKKGGNEKLEELLNKLSDDVSLCFQQRLKAGIGEAVTGLEDIGQSASSARHCLSCREFVEAESVFNYRNYKDFVCEMKESDIEFAKPMEKIGESLKLLKYQETRELLEEWFDSENVTAENLRDFYTEYLLALSKVASAHGVYLWKTEDYFSLLKRTHVAANKKLAKDSLLSITSEAFAEIQSRLTESSLKQNQIVSMAKKYVQENLTKPSLGFDEVCDHIGVTKIYFGRLFQKEEQVSFGSYINQERIELAKKLLRETNLRVSEVADHVGFSNSKYFSVVFKSLTGLTPLDYRRMKRFE